MLEKVKLYYDCAILNKKASLCLGGGKRTQPVDCSCLCVPLIAFLYPNHSCLCILGDIYHGISGELGNIIMHV